MTDSRQVTRTAARKNDYWQPNRYGRLVAPDRPRACRRQCAQDRDGVSARVIAAKQPRKRLSPLREPRFAKGSKHAWQRKRAAAEDLRRLLEQA